MNFFQVELAPPWGRLTTRSLQAVSGRKVAWCRDF
jgi:hypothetical protein